MNSATTRVLSALVLLPALLALIWWAPSLVFAAVMVGALSVGTMELGGMLGSPWKAFGFSLVYLAMPLALMVQIREHYGPGALMMMIGVIVVSDSAQYYTGRAFGRRKLAPVISPKKTVEGAIGGAIIATIAGVLFARLWLPEAPMLAAAIASLAMAVAGMAGDLFESALKRRAGIKDSGKLIPGHGGILDRIDSWLFAAPVFWVFLRVVVSGLR
ncbi:MAG: phosphatidate cytidylyltransferase [Acidobacteria bacterium]|nr:phosphatidate cytidylyltransferase [Acidobacteriota bacterium]